MAVWMTPLQNSGSNSRTFGPSGTGTYRSGRISGSIRIDIVSARGSQLQHAHGLHSDSEVEEQTPNAEKLDRQRSAQAYTIDCNRLQSGPIGLVVIRISARGSGSPRRRVARPRVLTGWKHARATGRNPSTNA
jgi:hypothetical protein